MQVVRSNIYRGGPLPEGLEVAVDVGLVRHKGIVTGRTRDGTPLVTSSSLRRGRAEEETLHEFAQGRAVLLLGFRGSLAPIVCAARAREMIGTPWSIFSNCEHFVSEACGEIPSSPQLQGWMALLLVATVLVAASPGRPSPR